MPLLGSSDLIRSGDVMLATLKAQNADYAWYGGLGLSDDGTCTDVMKGVVATSAARPGITTLGGRRAASFSGGQYLLSGLLPELAQPFAVVIATQRTGALTSDQAIVDGIGTSYRIMIRHYTIGVRYHVLQTANMYSSANTSNTSATILMCVFDGANSYLARNGATIATGNPGTQSFRGITLGAIFNGDNALIGTIGSCIVVSGTNFAARAAAIANAARQWYSTG